MAHVLVTTPFIRSANEPAAEPLVRDGHTLAFADPLAVRDPLALSQALDGVAATIASVEPYTAQVLERAQSLRVISRTGVGFDAVDVAAATARGVIVCTTPGTNQHAVADMAVALILACARQVVGADRWVRAGQWLPQPQGRELRGSTVGVVGTGLIGSEVVKRLWGFEPQLLAYDVVESPVLVERFGLRYVPFEQLLAESDFVTLHAPLLPTTRALLNATTLARMKPTAYLVNTARGPLVDEAALARALREHWIAGAALDVFEVEPLPADSPLRGLENVILTPHVAGTTAQSRLAMARMATENAARVLRGEAPLACVNPEALGPISPGSPR